jgi:hypothetical protein
MVVNSNAKPSMIKSVDTAAERITTFSGMTGEITGNFSDPEGRRLQDLRPERQ